MRSLNLAARNRRISGQTTRPIRIDTRRSHPLQLRNQLTRSLVGQESAIEMILPSVEMFQVGLSPEERPAGVFLLLGPSGTGKTRTVESLAEALHGSEKNLLKIDCGEFQMEHEVAKLIGAPPGYLGHRETPPLLNQQKINSISSSQSNLSLILFDEIEKAAPSMTRLLLGILDKAILRLGDNTHVNFERTMIFMTSNLGSNEMLKALTPKFGFTGSLEATEKNIQSRLSSIGMNAVRRKFTPEFVNRIDAVVTYQPLKQSDLRRILEMQVDRLQFHLNQRLGDRSFILRIPEKSKKRLLEISTSPEYGAREMKRTLHRNLLQPIAAMMAEDRIPPGAAVSLQTQASSFRLRVKQAG